MFGLLLATHLFLLSAEAGISVVYNYVRPSGPPGTVILSGVFGQKC